MSTAKLCIKIDFITIIMKPDNILLIVYLRTCQLPTIEKLNDYQYVCLHLGTAPIMCFLPTLIKQRGYSAGIAGLIFTLLMLPDVLIRPTVGFLTDKYKCRKSGLIACLITCILMVVILFLLPGATVENEMDNMDVIRSPLFWLFTGTVVLMKSGIMARCVLEDTICISLLGKNNFHWYYMCK